MNTCYCFLEAKHILTGERFGNYCMKIPKAISPICNCNKEGKRKPVCNIITQSLEDSAILKSILLCKTTSQLLICYCWSSYRQQKSLFRTGCLNPRVTTQGFITLNQCGLVLMGALRHSRATRNHSVVLVHNFSHTAISVGRANISKRAVCFLTGRLHPKCSSFGFLVLESIQRK